MEWLVMPLLRLVLLAPVAVAMIVLLGLPTRWVLGSFFLAWLASCMVTGLAEGGSLADEPARSEPALPREAECLMRFMLVMASVLTVLTVLRLLR